MNGTAVLLHTLFYNIRPTFPVSVTAELLEYYRRESMVEETGFAHSCIHRPYLLSRELRWSFRLRRWHGNAAHRANA